MFTRDQFDQIMKLQNEMNCIAASPTWIQDNLDWPTAIHIEVSEAIEHFGWKWWAKQTLNIDQVKIEMVDLLHFVISGTFTMKIPVTEIYDIYMENVKREKTNMNPQDQAEWDLQPIPAIFRYISHSATEHQYLSSLHFLLDIARRIDFAMDDMFNMYIAKNALNRFRKANGYKEGTYQKHWDDGREDNDHLIDLLKVTDVSRPDLMDYIALQLDALYQVNATNRPLAEVRV